MVGIRICVRLTARKKALSGLKQQTEASSGYYTIQVNTGGDPTSTLLQNCAGSKDKMADPTKFYMVTTSSGLASVFSSIGTGLTQLRVAK